MSMQVGMQQQQQQTEDRNSAGGVYIDISGYCVARDERGKDYIVFIIQIKLDTFVWTVYRRYSTFKHLSDELRKQIPGTPPCPPKKIIGSHTPTFLEQRRVELLEWIRQLARDERVCRSPIFHEFLRSQANVPPPGLVHPSESPLLRDAYYQAEANNNSYNSANGSAGNSLSYYSNEEHISDSVDANKCQQNSGSYAQESSHSSSLSSSNRKVSLRDFVLLKVIGKGSFGKVMQVKKKDNGCIYAMKVLHKANIVKRNQVEHTRTERNVLGRIVHPFIVGLNYAFQTKDRLYFVLDYCAGGELFFHLGREGRFPEQRSKFYAAQLVLALEHLHTLDVVYRDLKPENVLLDQQGYVRLTDFGLSKENIRSTDSGAHSFCGTPEYLAPEVLNRQGHGRAVDWWSLGALLYEMLTGLPPFYCKDRHKLYKRIKEGQLDFPNDMSPEAKDLLIQLLDRDPTRRLGSGPSDANEVKAHPFFRDVDWDALLDCRIDPPWKPPVHSTTDTSQFDEEFTSMPLHSPSSYREHGITPSMQSRTNFEGFTFVAPTTFGTTAQATASRARSESGAAAVLARAQGANGAYSVAEDVIPEQTTTRRSVHDDEVTMAENVAGETHSDSFHDTAMSISAQ